MKLTALSIFVWIAGFIALGFVQERAKVSLNYYLDRGALEPQFFEFPPERRDAWLQAHAINAPYDYYYNHARVKWYDHLSRKQLELLKWMYAIIFIVLHVLLSHLALKLWKAPREMLVTIYIGTVVVMLLSLCFFAASRVGAGDAAYNVARKLLGFIQSPLPLVLLLFTRRLGIHTSTSRL